MLDIDRHSAGTHKVGERGLPAFLTYASVHRERPRDAVSAVAHRGGTIQALLLVIVLAVAAIALSPGSAQVCAKLEDFPCGP
jgi:hypothetical protein